MKNYQHLSTLGKAISTVFLGSGILVSAGAQAAVSQAPLSLTEGVAPNMLLTLDDSGSMRFAFAPDAISTLQDTKRAKSSTFNPMYYNPSTVYEIPPFFDSNGKEVKLVTSFEKAWNNGFNEDAGFVNLNSEYRVSWDIPITSSPTSYNYTESTNYTGTGRIYRLGKNNSDDFSCSVNLHSNNSSKECTTSAGITITIRRGSNENASSCTATSVAWNGSAGCTRTGNRNNNYQYSPDIDRSVRAYYYIYDESLAGCNRRNDDDNCYKLKLVDNDERQNFANWYSFYRNRALTTLSAAAVSFYSLSSDIRLSWQALTNCNAFDTEGDGCGKNKIQPYSVKHRGGLYNWLSIMKFDGGTPLRLAMDRAGKFLQTSKVWDKDLLVNANNNSRNRYACRPSYHILMTDGMWNGANANIESPWHDDENFTLPDGTAYLKSRPYKDSTSNTLADVAMHYWATDLSNIENKVPAHIPYKNTNTQKEYWDPRNNPATWQSMTNFIVGLSLSNSLNNNNIPWAGSTHEGVGYENLLSNQDWPAAASDSSNNVYDLWHAAINSRGEFYSADSPEAMVQAFNNILTRIASRKSTAAAPATNNSLESDISNPDDPQDRLVSYSYQSSFDNTEDWVGELKLVKTWRQWVSDGEGGGGFESHAEDVWSASKKVPTLNRKLRMAGPDASGLQDFSTTNANTQLKNWLNINPESGKNDNRWEDRLNYLRGDQSKEGEGDTQFRKRTQILGDFLASQPAVVQRAQYLELFSNKLEGNTKYTAFITDIKNRASRIYIGGNDGMLHAFDASAGADGGKETFAFIPTAVFPNLNKLTGKNYTHHYYVDGSPEVADVYDHDAGIWKTILVGTLRAGGKGLFALDITTPGQEKLLWEFDEFNYKSNGGYKNDMVGPGYSFPKPTIARLHNGRWAVVTGNGYEGANSNNGKAALYVIDAITGKLHKSLEVESATKSSNGLSSPRLADYDGDGVADYAYAGDLHGNLWRFDLLGTGANPERNLVNGPIYGDKNSNSTDGFKVSYNGTPMFTATAGTGSTAQPITAAPSLTRHPSGNGYLVILGTGKYFEDGDKTGTESHAQSLYAIWDEKTRAEITSSTGMPINRSSLVEQKIEQTDLDAKGYTSGLDRKARTLSDNAVSYYDNNGNVTKKGWYLDLAADSNYEGEMMIENMRVLGRDTLLISTLVPNDDPCAHGAGNWLYALNPATGGRTKHHAFDTRIKNPNGSYTLVSAIKLGSEGGLSLGQDELGITAFGESIDLGNNGRLRGNRAGSWRMIPNP